MAETATHFVGHENRECGEHRTTGPRAWCFDCSEWCYPAIPCKGCELPTLRAAVERVEALLTSGPIGRVSGERYIRADLIRDALRAPDSPSPSPSPVSAATGEHDGTGEAQRGSDG